MNRSYHKKGKDSIQNWKRKVQKFKKEKVQFRIYEKNRKRVRDKRHEKKKKGSLQIQKKRLQLTPNKALKRRVA